MHKIMEPCILHTGAMNDKGYPCIKASLWKRILGPYPKELEVDHLCGNRMCVNPNHLELVTHKENLRRSVFRRTHCKNGHPKTAENLYVGPKGNFACLACIRSRKYYQTHREYILRREFLRRVEYRKSNPYLSREQRSEIARSNGLKTKRSLAARANSTSKPKRRIARELPNCGDEKAKNSETKGQKDAKKVLTKVLGYRTGNTITCGHPELPPHMVVTAKYDHNWLGCSDD